MMANQTINKVCIIGASGLIAQETINAFDHQGFRLRLFSRSIKSEKYPHHETITGDVFNDYDLATAIDGCDALHITLAQLDEYLAVKRIVAMAKKLGSIKLIGFVSGATVNKANSALLPFIDAKYHAEQHLKLSGIPYVITRPTWFMESLSLMIQNGSANIMGKQPNKLRWIAARDYGNIVARAYKNPECHNHEFNVYGPESLTINEALLEYVKVKHPELTKIRNTPFWLLKLIAFLTNNQQLKTLIPMFEYFETTTEVGDPSTTERLIGKPSTTLKSWLSDQAAH